MVLDGGLSIFAVISLANTLFRIYRKISPWLKRRENTLWKEDQRIMKIVKAYFKRTTNKRQRLPLYIRVLIERLQERKEAQWMEAPGARKAERQALAAAQYEEGGHITDVDGSDSDDAEYGGYSYAQTEEYGAYQTEEYGFAQQTGSYEDDSNGDGDSAGDDDEDDDDDDDDDSDDSEDGNDEDALGDGESDEDDYDYE